MKTKQERGTSDEETVATHVDSEPAVAGINLDRTNLTIKDKSTRLQKIHTFLYMKEKNQ